MKLQPCFQAVICVYLCLPHIDFVLYSESLAPAQGFEMSCQPALVLLAIPPGPGDWPLVLLELSHMESKAGGYFDDDHCIFSPKLGY